MLTLRIGWVPDWKFKNGIFEKNKGRPVTNSNHQDPGMDYNKSFSPVIGLESPSTSGYSSYQRIQFDITSAYLLHSTFKEEIYI